MMCYYQWEPAGHETHFMNDELRMVGIPTGGNYSNYPADW